MFTKACSGLKNWSCLFRLIDLGLLVALAHPKYLDLLTGLGPLAKMYKNISEPFNLFMIVWQVDYNRIGQLRATNRVGWISTGEQR